jgi:MshEN domain
VPHDGVVDAAPAGDAAGRIPLGRLLVAEGLLTESQVDDALFEGGQTGERLGEIVVRRGLMTEEQLAKALAEQWSLSYVDRASIWFDGDALARMSREDAQRLEAMPTRVQDGRVVVAVAEPTEDRIAALREVIGGETVVVVVPRTALDAALSSELLTSRTAGEQAEAAPPAPTPQPEQSPPPPEPVELLPPPMYRTDAPPQAPPPAAYEPAPMRYQPPPTPQQEFSGDELEWFRSRVARLEGDVAKQRRMMAEVQLHLQAALRTLLLNDVGGYDDPSHGGGPSV